VFVGKKAITTQSELEEVFGTGTYLGWYNGETLLGTGFSYLVSTNQNSISINCRLITGE